MLSYGRLCLLSALLVAVMGRSIAAVKKCATYLTSTICRQVVQTLVLSHLDYCLVIWASVPQTELRKLRTARNRAARLALNCSYSFNVDQMHSHLKWSKVINSLVLCYLLNILSILSTLQPLLIKLDCPDVHQYRTRTSTHGLLTLPCPRTNAMKRTVIGLFLYGRPLNIRNIPRKDVFKRHAKSLFQS